MSTYSEAAQLKETLKGIVNEMIENHPLVKSAIKVKKATVANVSSVPNPVNTTSKTVVVQFPFDTTLVTLPYNPKMESYLTTGTVKGKTVSVWFYQSIQNGIVMQDGSWGQ